jgi:hypothetical protein
MLNLLPEGRILMAVEFLDGGELSKLGVDEREQLGGRLVVTGLGGIEKAGHIRHDEV